MLVALHDNLEKKEIQNLLSNKKFERANFARVAQWIIFFPSDLHFLINFFDIFNSFI